MARYDLPGGGWLVQVPPPPVHGPGANRQLYAALRRGDVGNLGGGSYKAQALVSFTDAAGHPRTANLWSKGGWDASTAFAAADDWDGDVVSMIADVLDGLYGGGGTITAIALTVSEVL